MDLFHQPIPDLPGVPRGADRRARCYGMANRPEGPPLPRNKLREMLASPAARPPSAPVSGLRSACPGQRCPTRSRPVRRPASRAPPPGRRRPPEGSPAADAGRGGRWFLGGAGALALAASATTGAWLASSGPPSDAVPLGQPGTAPATGPLPRVYDRRRARRASCPAVPTALPELECSARCGSVAPAPRPPGYLRRPTHLGDVRRGASCRWRWSAPTYDEVVVAEPVRQGAVATTFRLTTGIERAGRLAPGGAPAGGRQRRPGLPVPGRPGRRTPSRPPPSPVAEPARRPSPVPDRPQRVPAVQGVELVRVEPVRHQLRRPGGARPIRRLRIVALAGRGQGHAGDHGQQYAEQRENYAEKILTAPHDQQNQQRKGSRRGDRRHRPRIGPGQSTHPSSMS